MARELERCCECDEPTGRAGRGDDLLYAKDGAGPFCRCRRHIYPTTVTLSDEGRLCELCAIEKEEKAIQVETERK